MTPWFPAPLEPTWEGVLSRALGRRIDARALAVMVERQSRIYNGDASVSLARADALAARTLFWFPRDVLKVARPLAELVASGALPARPLRVLDVGAGLGATSLGMVRALAGTDVRVARIDALDLDADTLRGMQSIAREAERAGLLPGMPELVTRAVDLRVPTSLAESVTEPADLVVIGSALVEVTRDAGDELARGAAIAAHVTACIDAARLASDGAVVVLEPATRPEARALHHARAALIAQGLGVFAPCTHQAACPMLTRERDWCHEDLASTNLPDWLHPVAREAGLRWEGLTFSYLVVRRDTSRSVGDAETREGFVPARLVSQPRETKGKTEAIACAGRGAEGHGARVMQLARDVKRDGGAHTPLAARVRGEVFALTREAFDASRDGKVVRLGL